MGTKTINALVIVFATAITLSLLSSSYRPGQASIPAQTDHVAAEPTRTAAPIALPEMTLKPGDFYFRVDGIQNFLFGRNITSYQQKDFETVLDWAQTGGSRLVRIQLIEGLGPGITSTGAVDETWARNWERVFDKAYADGLSIIPVFGSWFAWNSRDGHLWAPNPLNQAKGGPAKTPGELFQKDSVTQSLWLQWLKSLVTRWRTRKNIVAWEIFSELNLVSGASERAGVDFVERAASIIRALDPDRRPISASLADFREWDSLYRSQSISFIEIHPYPPSGQLDSYIISSVRQKLAQYGKPVLIGESGLSASTPDSKPATLTTADRAAFGIKHAIWAAMVSGAMNGRLLYWEDSYGVYFPAFGLPFVRKYATVELAAANFVKGVDFAGFQPLIARSSIGSKITGAAIGNEKTVIGWFRDVDCEPPKWNLQPVISKQIVTITVPGSFPTWRVDFYSTETGTDIISSITAARKGNSIAVALPDFADDIAFKMYVQK